MVLSRRIVLGTALAALSLPARAAVPTPAQTEGPFYPTPAMRNPDTDNDLVRVTGAVRAAGGEIVFLGGRVLDRTGQSVEGAEVEIWQCDANGIYHHDRAPGRGRDRGFQGFGRDRTDEEGRYTFRTILPVPYPGRTPHIHVKVRHARYELTTQFYLAGDPRNRADGIWRRLSPVERRALAMDFRTVGGRKQAVVDIVL